MMVVYIQYEEKSNRRQVLGLVEQRATEAPAGRPLIDALPEATTSNFDLATQAAYDKITIASRPLSASVEINWMINGAKNTPTNLRLKKGCKVRDRRCQRTAIAFT